MDETDLDVVSGPDLFRQLLRLLPTSEYQDYFKNGVWQDKVMRLDAKILIGHRQESGAPEIIPLEEVTMPELPKSGAQAVVSSMAGQKAAGGGQVILPNTPAFLQEAHQRLQAAQAAKAAPGLVAASGTPAKQNLSSAAKPAVIPKLYGSQASRLASAVKTPVLPATAKLARAMAAVAAAKAKAKAAGKAVPPPNRPPMTGAPRAVAAPPKANPAYKVALGKGIGKVGGKSGNTVPPSIGGGTVSSVVANDLKQISAFVSRHGLDTTKTKLALAKLTPPKRQYVIANFKNAPAVSKYGTTSYSPSIVKLEQFIVQCSRTNAWGAAKVVPPSGSTGSGAALGARVGALGASLRQGVRPTPLLRMGLKRPMPAATVSTDASKRLRLVAPAAGGKGIHIPQVVAKYGTKPAPYVAAQQKGAPQPAAGHKVLSSWSNSSSSAAGKSWNSSASNSGGSSKGKSSGTPWAASGTINKTWDASKSSGKGSSWSSTGKSSWGGQPQQRKPEPLGGGIIASLLSKY